LSDVGFTTSVPIEILLAAGKRPVDLNNVFIARRDAVALVKRAEEKGFPAACCAWVKGIYAVASTLDLEEVIGVVRGDCSQTQALMEVLQMDGLPVYPFAYPYDRCRSTMRAEIRRMQAHFGASAIEIANVKRQLDKVRRKLKRLDQLTWLENRVSGEENHTFLVASSDMRGDPRAYEKEVDQFLREAACRDPCPVEKEIRLGIIGVPPIWPDFFRMIEREGVRVVYNEVQRQFSMPNLAPDIVSQYLSFTYPYDVFYRLEDIRREASRRKIDGFIHYVQAFCFRQIEDQILRKCLPRPVLTVEGDLPHELDSRVQMRLEAFIEMLVRHRDHGSRPCCRN